MADKEIKILSESALRQLRRDRDLARTNGRPVARRQQGGLDAGPPNLIFEIPADGINPIDSGGVSSADCVAYQITEDGTLREVLGTRKLYNLSPNYLEEGQRVIGHLDAWGRYVATPEPCSNRTPATVVIPGLVANAALTKLLVVNTTIRFGHDKPGCLIADAETTGTGEEINLCCGSSGSGDGCTPTATLELRLECDSDRLRVPSQLYSSYIGGYFEIITLSASTSSIGDGDLVTFTTTFKVRDDLQVDSLDQAKVMLNCGGVWGGRGWINPNGNNGTNDAGLGIVATNISRSINVPACAVKGVTYTFTETWQIDFSFNSANAECKRFLNYYVFIPANPATLCWPCPATRHMLFSTHTVAASCLEDRPWPTCADLDDPCPESSGSSSGPGSSSGGGGGPSSSGMGA